MPAQGLGFQANHHEMQPGLHTRSDRRPIFDDKIASSDVMKYSDARRTEWVKTTTNYLISKALEMKHYLQWAESFQGHEISHAHVRGLANSGLCRDHDPFRLSFELWGHLNLSLHGEEKITFNNVEPGNGVDAWRRIVVPIGPRREAQLHRTHKAVMTPPTSRKLVDVLVGIEIWEGQLREYYLCGGSGISDGTKVLIAMGM